MNVCGTWVSGGFVGARLAGEGVFKNVFVGKPGSCKGYNTKCGNHSEMAGM